MFNDVAKLEAFLSLLQEKLSREKEKLPLWQFKVFIVICFFDMVKLDVFFHLIQGETSQEESKVPTLAVF